MFVRHLSYILVPGSLLRQLRKASTHPQILFGLMFICDLMGLALLLPIVAKEIAPMLVTPANMMEVLQSALPHGGWWAILRGENLTGTTVVTRTQGGSLDLGAPRTLWAGLRISIVR